MALLRLNCRRRNDRIDERIDAMAGKPDFAFEVSPRDSFKGRSGVRFGVGEFIDLQATVFLPEGDATPPILRWCTDKDPSGGAVTQTHNEGTGVYTALYTAGPKAGDVTLACKSGPKADTTEYRKTIQVVEPNDAVMVQRPGTHIYHQQGTWSVGFIGNIYLQPTDVSFNNCTFQEGAVEASVHTGYLKDLHPRVHPLGQVRYVGEGNRDTGCRVLGSDTACFTRAHTPYADGEFEWPIPWRFGVRVPSPGKPPSDSTVFTTAKQHATADAGGRATITKKNCGPFTQWPDDQTSGFWYGPDSDWPWPPRTAKPDGET
jgi:hypothetical protein